jgi:hypothetical protein
MRGTDCPTPRKSEASFEELNPKRLKHLVNEEEGHGFISNTVFD